MARFPPDIYFCTTVLLNQLNIFEVSLICTRFLNPSHPNPGRREKNELNFYFLTVFRNTRLLYFSTNFKRNCYSSCLMAVKWEKQYKFTWNICALNHCFLKSDTCAYQGLEMLVFWEILRTYLMDGSLCFLTPLPPFCLRTTDRQKQWFGRKYF